MSTRPKTVSVTAYSCTAATGSLIRLYQTPRQAARSRSRRSRRPSTPVPGWNFGGASTWWPRHRLSSRRCSEPSRRDSRSATVSSSRPTTVPMIDAETVKPASSSTTKTENPATPASPPKKQKSSSWRVRRVSGAPRTMPATRRSSSSIDLLSRVAAGQRPAARDQRDRRVPAQHAEPDAGRQAVRHRLDGGHRVLRDQHGHELADRVLDRGTQRQQDEREHE